MLINIKNTNNFKYIKFNTITMNCPECNSENYSFKKTKRGTIWKCADCNFKRVNKTADQILKEDPLSGAIKREVEKIEKKYTERKNKPKKKELSANDIVEFIKSKTKKYKIVKKKEGFYQFFYRGDRKMEVIERKKWISLYLKKNEFKVQQIKTKDEMKEVLDGTV